jgi:hypothetical protein
MIYVENKRRKLERIKKQYPNADILDVTSSSDLRYAQLLSPFYPHGNIPIPFSPGYTSYSVEGIWQGLKVFKSCGIDMNSFSNNTMGGLKRTISRYGYPLGHQKGINSKELLDYFEARMLIYIPSYKWVLDNVPEVVEIIKRIKQRSVTNDIVLLDYNTNVDFCNISSPISHAGLIKLYIEDRYPDSNGNYVPYHKKRNKKNYQLTLFNND